MNLPRQVDLMCIAEVRIGRDELHQLAPAFSLLLSVLRWLSAREPTDELGRGNHRKSPLSCSPVSFSGNNRRRAQPPPPAALSEKPSAINAAVMCLRMKSSGDMSCPRSGLAAPLDRSCQHLLL